MVESLNINDVLDQYRHYNIRSIPNTSNDSFHARRRRKPVRILHTSDLLLGLDLSHGLLVICKGTLQDVPIGRKPENCRRFRAYSK